MCLAYKINFGQNQPFFYQNTGTKTFQQSNIKLVCVNLKAYKGPKSKMNSVT